MKANKDKKAEMNNEYVNKLENHLNKKMNNSEQYKIN